MKKIISSALLLFILLCGIGSVNAYYGKTNFASGKLTSTIPSGATTGYSFTMLPSTNSGEFPASNFLVTIYPVSCLDAASCSKREIILISSRSGNTFTIGARNQDGTTHNTDWNVNSHVDHSITAGAFTELQANIDASAQWTDPRLSGLDTQNTSTLNNAVASSVTTTSFSTQSMGTAFFSSRYVSLNAVHAAAAAVSGGVMILDSATSLSSDLTTTVPLIPQGGTIDLNGHNITAGPFQDPGPVQVFTGSGAVTFGAGSVSFVNAKWFPSGVTQIQQAINAASWFIHRAYAPSGNYTSNPLYMYYDSVLNPGFNPNPYEGTMEFFGDIAEGEAQYDAGYPLGTVITFNNTTGQSFIKDKDATFNGYESTDNKYHDFAIIVNNNDYAMALKWFHSHSSIYDLFIKQLNPLGSGLLIQEAYMFTANRIMIQGPSATNKMQTGFRLYNQAAGGGMITIDMITTRNTVTGYDIGGHTYNDGIANAITNFSLKRAQTADFSNVGAFVGWKVQSANLDLYTEQTTTYLGINSVIVAEGAQKVDVGGDTCWLSAPVSNAQACLGCSSSGTGTHAPGSGVSNCRIEVTDNTTGIYAKDSTTIGYHIENNLFWPHTSPATNATGITLDGIQGTVLLKNDYASLTTNLTNTNSGAPALRLDKEIQGRRLYIATTGTASINMDGYNFGTLASASTLTISDITPRTDGKSVMLRCVNSNVHIVNSSPFYLQSAFDCTANKSIILWSDGANWYESR